MNASLLKLTMCWRQMFFFFVVFYWQIIFSYTNLSTLLQIYPNCHPFCCVHFFHDIQEFNCIIQARQFSRCLHVKDSWRPCSFLQPLSSRYSNRSPQPGRAVTSKIKQVWNVERAAWQRFDGELRWGKERPARASERARRDNDVGPGTRGDCTVKRETFRLRAVEGRRKGERWRGHFSSRAHPFHSVFLGPPSGHHLPFPSSDYPSIYHYICGKKPSLAHILITSVHSQSRKAAAGFP